MTDLRNDWNRLVDHAAAVSSIAIELSAVSASELPGLLRYLGSAPRLPFLFISVHAPSKGLNGDEQGHVEALCTVPAWVDAVVVHPDTISDPALYRPLGRRLVVENMVHANTLVMSPTIYLCCLRSCRRLAYVSMWRMRKTSTRQWRSRLRSCAASQVGSRTSTSALWMSLSITSH